MKSDRIILGIDPGTTIMGYGLIRQKGNQISLIKMGVIKLGKLKDQMLKLQMIFNRTVSLIDEYKPDEMAIEAPFYGKNVQSMLKLGRAQGVAMAAGLHRSVPIFEYSPRKIKQSITGNGNASKEQVAGMLSKLIGPLLDIDSLDATDGLAVSVCHYFQKRITPAENSYTSWKNFMIQNPDRIGQ